MCIPLSKVCDKKPDCPNFEDEPRDKCGENECAKNNGGCTQRCVDTPVGYYCDCDKGYNLVDNRTCEGKRHFSVGNNKIYGGYCGKCGKNEQMDGAHRDASRIQASRQ